MGAVDVVERELRDLDYRPEVVDFPGFNFGRVVIFDYSVTTGRYRGRTFRVGIGFQEEGYPEYPPHFVLVADLPHAHLTKHSTHQIDGQVWSVFSVPPGDFWDKLASADKNLKTYVRRHLMRVWREL